MGKVSLALTLLDSDETIANDALVTSYDGNRPQATNGVEEDNMTILEVVQTVIGIVGLPTAIFSVLLLARQTRQLKESIYSQVYQGVIQYSLKVDEILDDR